MQHPADETHGIEIKNGEPLLKSFNRILSNPTTARSFGTQTAFSP